MSEAIILVVARASNGVIGKDGKLPWHLPADLKRFKQLTMGTAMIMGRKTFESLPGLLPGRRHIVITRDTDWHAQGAEVVHSIAEALDAAKGHKVSIIGGSEIFDLFLPCATAVELTEIHADFDGDTVMQPLDSALWREVHRQNYPAEDKGPAFSFVRLERRQSE